jgi:tRNA G10  N-methylase Trm11
MAELEHLYGSDATRWFSDQSAIITSDSFSINHLGGVQKAARVTIELPRADWRDTSLKIVQMYGQLWSHFEGKITLGISAYGFDVDARDIQKAGILLKQKLKKNNVSLRLIPNPEPALNSATSHHNKLGLSDNKIELIVVRARNGRVIVSESVGAQNITAYTRRDQERPKRDAFVGMLPPKLAQIMINLALPLENARSSKASSDSVAVSGDNLQPKSEMASGPNSDLERSLSHGIVAEGANRTSPLRLLDPFCGTGVILQEAALMGHAVYGTDIADKMIDFTRTNLEWLASTHHVDIDASLHTGDAMDTKWQPPLDAVVCESYLGQPFSAPPSPSKLDQVRRNCNHIIETFLQNIAPQLPSGTPLCVAVPAWRSNDGRFTHLPLVDQLALLGFAQYTFKNVDPSDLLYYREDQVVARELLVLVKS